MKYLKISIGIFFALAVTRFVPHPPNFTSLIALSFYVPALFGPIYLPAVIFSFALTDIIIGFHKLTLFTWGSVFIIGIVSKFFLLSVYSRILGALTGAVIFFIVTNFGVWLVGNYEYSLNGLITCYYMALPFFAGTIVSTLVFSLIIEFMFNLFMKSNLAKYLSS